MSEVSDGVGPMTFAAALGIILIIVAVLNAVLTAFGQNMQKINVLGVTVTFPPQGSQQLFTQTSLMFYVLAAALFLALVFTAWKTIREQ